MVCCPAGLPPARRTPPLGGACTPITFNYSGDNRTITLAEVDAAAQGVHGLSGMGHQLKNTRRPLHSPRNQGAALLPDSSFTVLHQTITSQKNLRKKARWPAVPSSALNFPAKIPPSKRHTTRKYSPQLKAPPHPEPPAPRTGHSGYPAPGTAPPIQPRPPGDRARRHRKGCGSHRPCAPGGSAGAACP